jgi:hypothetical protein
MSCDINVTFTEQNNTVTFTESNPITIEFSSSVGSVTSVFGRGGAVVAQSGDYTADQVTETATRLFLTPEERTAISVSVGDAFETVSKNLESAPYTLNYTGDNLTSVVYTVAAGTITKTLNYTDDNLTSIVFTGDTPSGIDLTKTLTYTGNNLTSVAYS